MRKCTGLNVSNKHAASTYRARVAGNNSPALVKSNTELLLEPILLPLNFKKLSYSYIRPVCTGLNQSWDVRYSLHCNVTTSLQTSSP
jgi:hypothetical protein